MSKKRLGDRRKLHNCKECANPTRNKQFCSMECSSSYRSRENYELYLSNQESFCNKESFLKSFKKFFLQDQDNKCAVCNCNNQWNDKLLVFVLDHIDGNSQNNLRSNLRLVCPNCDSQLDTFKSRNRGNGRFNRNKRRLEGKSY